MEKKTDKDAVKGIDKDQTKHKDKRELADKREDLEASKLSVLEASATALATANDPMNKTLRGIAEHISTKLDDANKSLRNGGLENTKEMQKGQNGIQKQTKKHSEKEAEHNEMHL